MTYLVGGLVKLLGIERSTNAEGDTGAEKDVVSNGGDTAVVDLGLDERDGVEAVLAGNLEADSVAALGVPGGLGTSLNLGVDLVVVRGSEDAQVVRRGDGSDVSRGSIADGGAVASDGALLDVVASRGTSKETLMADNGIDVGGGTLEEVEEGAAVEVGLLVVEVELGTPGVVGGKEGEDTLSLETLGDAVVQLQLALKSVGSVPRLGKGEACPLIKH